MKNVSKDAFGEKVGRIHMEHQDFSKLELRKMKANRKSRVGLAAGAGVEVEGRATAKRSRADDGVAGESEAGEPTAKKRRRK